MIIVNYWLEKARIYDLLDLKNLGDLCRKQAKERALLIAERIAEPICPKTLAGVAGGPGEVIFEVKA